MGSSEIHNAKDGNVVTVAPDDAVERVWSRIVQMGQGLAVVCDENGFPIGIISVIDISPTLAEDGDQAAGTAVREIMATNLVMYALHDSVEEALDRTMERRGRHSPVVAEGRATLSRRVRP